VFEACVANAQSAAIDLKKLPQKQRYQTRPTRRAG